LWSRRTGPSGNGGTSGERGVFRRGKARYVSNSALVRDGKVTYGGTRVPEPEA
jgi:hypothetical protein